MDWKFGPSAGLTGEITVPPDKSISHRAIMFGAISEGEVDVKNFLMGEDCLHTLKAFKALGVDIDIKGANVRVNGSGLKGLQCSDADIYMGNSGTSMRIIPGILAGQGFDSVLDGDGSLRKRPMSRVIDPLERMGAVIEFIGEQGCVPFRIKKCADKLIPIRYNTPVASAQVKSCILSAGLYADGETTVIEPYQSRDHTERMLKSFSAGIHCNGVETSIKGGIELVPRDVFVPGDISSAAFLMVGALIVNGSRIILKDVGMNPTRTGILAVLERMNADIRILDLKDDVEPWGDIEVKGSYLKGTVVSPEEIPLLIDEIPVLAVAAAMAEGETILKGVSELKVKETDRVKSMQKNMSRMGVKMYEDGEDLVISGGNTRLTAAISESFGDHRTAMSMAIAALVSDGDNIIENVDCVSTSYPDFFQHLNSVAY